ncbi:MAG: hypothetical protein N2515_03675, partial [Deltaproteobacteria bacterium]|nr:hypothetical protein [Deltaproteobacteria bacterium]
MRRSIEILMRVYGMLGAFGWVWLGCDGARESTSVGADGSKADAATTPICLGPVEGCGCTVEGKTIECWGGPIFENGVERCLVGRMTCRKGVWSGCEDLQEIDKAPQEGVILASMRAPGAATQCDPCRPRCFVNDHLITPSDLDPRKQRSMGPLVWHPRGGAANRGEWVMCRSLSCGIRNQVGRNTENPWNPTPQNSEGVMVDPSDGALVLGVQGINSPGVWIANMN